jgi:hypothetical protein
MYWHPPCDCAESQKPNASVTADISNGRKEHEVIVNCTHCGRLLKPICTVEGVDPRTGLRQLWTKIPLLRLRSA